MARAGENREEEMVGRDRRDSRSRGRWRLLGGIMACGVGVCYGYELCTLHSFILILRITFLNQ